MKNLIYIFVIAVLTASCNMADNAANMKSDAIKAHVQGFYDKVVNGHNPAAIDSFVTADFINHNPDPGHSGHGAEDLKAGFAEFISAFPDIHVTINYLVVEGDKCVAHITMTGTNSGAMGAMPATNKQMSIDGIDVVTIKDGKATERWGIYNNMKMMADLGMMPPPGAPPAPPAEPMKTEEKKK